MKFYKNLKAALLHISMLAVLFSLAISAVSAQGGGKDGSEGSSNNGSGNGNGNGNSNNSDSSLNDMQIVAQLFKQNRFAEAVPYLERLVKADPDDADLRFLYGFALLIKSKDIADKTQSRQMQIQARNEFLKAKELGAKEEVIDKLIASLPKDGDSSTDTDVSVQSSTTTSTNTNSATFSSNKDAQEYMVKGEAFFTKGEYEKAFEMYEKALKKDPNLYEAALFSGDAFLMMGDNFLKENNAAKQKESYDKAESWYQRAMIINPNRETAYRYSATPLMKLKQYDKARDRYVEAYITEPYNARALDALKKWAEITETEVGHPIINIPADINTTDNNSANADGSFAWSAYAQKRATWQLNRNGLSENFKKTYPNESTYRRSLAEEFDAMRATVLLLKERMSGSANPVKKLNPDLATLVKLYDEGLLESYIVLAMKDEGIAQDQPNYLKQNREKMRQYVIKYVVGNG